MSDIRQDFESLRDHLSISGPYVPPSVILTERQVAELERGMIELQHRADKAEAERDELKDNLERVKAFVDAILEKEKGDE